MIKCSICTYQCDNWYVSNWRLDYCKSNSVISRHNHHNLSPFTKGCRERDASMWLSQFLGNLGSNKCYCMGWFGWFVSLYVFLPNACNIQFGVCNATLSNFHLEAGNANWKCWSVHFRANWMRAFCCIWCFLSLEVAMHNCVKIEKMWLQKQQLDITAFTS